VDKLLQEVSMPRLRSAESQGANCTAAKTRKNTRGAQDSGHLFSTL
jgi:hypothetical protein